VKTHFCDDTKKLDYKKNNIECYEINAKKIIDKFYNHDFKFATSDCYLCICPLCPERIRKEEERLEKERIERLEKIEEERLERLEKERLERLEKKRLERLEKEVLEKERLKKEKLETERLRSLCNCRYGLKLKLTCENCKRKKYDSFWQSNGYKKVLKS